MLVGVMGLVWLLVSARAVVRARRSPAAKLNPVMGCWLPLLPREEGPFARQREEHPKHPKHPTQIGVVRRPAQTWAAAASSHCCLWSCCCCYSC